MRHVLCLLLVAVLLVAASAAASPPQAPPPPQAPACRDVGLPPGANPLPLTCPCGTSCDCAACDGVSCGSSALEWRAFSDHDLTQCMLVDRRTGRQVGCWTWGDRRFWPIVTEPDGSRAVSRVPATVPIPPPYSPQWPSGRVERPAAQPAYFVQPNAVHVMPGAFGAVSGGGCSSGG
jgi:hypothetical protein